MMSKSEKPRYSGNVSQAFGHIKRGKMEQAVRVENPEAKVPQVRYEG